MTGHHDNEDSGLQLKMRQFLCLPTVCLYLDSADVIFLIFIEFPIFIVEKTPHVIFTNRQHQKSNGEYTGEVYKSFAPFASACLFWCLFQSMRCCGSVVVCATCKQEIAGVIAGWNEFADTMPRARPLLTRALSRPRSKWVPGKTVKVSVCLNIF